MNSGFGNFPGGNKGGFGGPGIGGPSYNDVPKPPIARDNRPPIPIPKPNDRPGPFNNGNLGGGKGGGSNFPPTMK